MKGYPKTIGTGRDLLNLLQLVQAGELEAADLKASIEALKACAWQTVPVLEVSADRKTVTVRYCAEAEKGKVTASGAKIVEVEHLNDEEGEPEKTVLTMSAAIPARSTAVLIPAALDPLEKIGTDEATTNSILEVLKSYEISH